MLLSAFLKSYTCFSVQKQNQFDNVTGLRLTPTIIQDRKVIIFLIFKAGSVIIVTQKNCQSLIGVVECQLTVK